MRLWKVQYAYAVEVGLPAVHRTEESAKGEVAYLLGNWLMKNLASVVRNEERMGEEHAEFVMDGKAVANQIIGMLNAGQVWEAYDVWQEFYDKYEFEFATPLFVTMGTVLVETNQAAGPTRRGRPMIQRTAQRPIEQYGEQRQSDRPLVFGMREELEVDTVLRQVTNKLVRKLQAEGKQMTRDEFTQHLVEVLEQVTGEAQASGEKLTAEEFTLRMETALARHFGLSGSRRRGAVLRRFS
jgi:hypothetical protein